MKRSDFVACLFLITSMISPAVAQATPVVGNEGKEVVIELRSPWIPTLEKRKNAKTHRYDPTIRGRNCVSLITLQQICHGSNTLSYGNMIGDNWDIFSVASSQDQTRMIDLGSHTWDDKFEVPMVEPWPPLAPGEKRTIIIALRGADGAHGRNGDGTVAAGPKPRKGNGAAPLAEQVSTTVTTKKVVRADKYMPLHHVENGQIYLVRVIEGEWDSHLLLRVDELVRGERVRLSFRRLSVNPEGPR